MIQAKKQYENMESAVARAHEETMRGNYGAAMGNLIHVFAQTEASIKIIRESAAYIKLSRTGIEDILMALDDIKTYLMYIKEEYAGFKGCDERIDTFVDIKLKRMEEEAATAHQKLSEQYMRS